MRLRGSAATAAVVLCTVAATAVPARAVALVATVNPPVQCPAPRVTGANPWPKPSPTPLPVVAPVIPDLPVPTATHAANFLTAYTRALRFNLISWFPTCYGGQTGPVNPGGTNEQAIRTPAMVASAVALALASKGYNPTAVGMSRYVAAQRVRHIAVGLAMNHKVNAGLTGWGRSVQSAYWAFHAGWGAWLVWPSLTAADRQCVARMVAYEADWRRYQPVRYYRDRNGVILTPGDTGAEENAWNATVLYLAAAMLPTDPRAAGWRHQAIQLMAASFAKPSDLTNTTIVDGKPIKDWLAGSNINEDGTLVNHNIINPDYMSTIRLNMYSLLVARYANQAGPQSALWNNAVVYSALINKSFRSPPYLAPGGTIYKRGTGNIYYPQGNDWGTVRPSMYAALDALVATTRVCDACNPRYWEAYHLLRLLQMQVRFTDGRTYAGRYTDPNSEDVSVMREQVVVSDLGGAWANEYLKQPPAPT